MTWRKYKKLNIHSMSIYNDDVAQSKQWRDPWHMRKWTSTGFNYLNIQAPAHEAVMPVCTKQCMRLFLQRKQEYYKKIATTFLQINNICILSGYVLTRWKLGTNIMLPKNIGVHDINKMRWISLLEPDLNLILKLKLSKHVMQNIEDHPSRNLLTDNQNCFHPNRSTYQAVLRE